MPPAFLLADPHVSHLLSEEDINSYVAALGKSLFTTGMIVATAISIVAVPMLYHVVQSITERLKGKTTAESQTARGRQP